MVKNINDLAERIKKVDKEAKVSLIYELMLDYDISTGDLLEFSVNKGKATLTTSERLREINQARKTGRNYLENLAKARQAKVEKREKLMAVSREVAPTVEKPKLVVGPIDLSLESIVDEDTEMD